MDKKRGGDDDGDGDDGGKVEEHGNPVNEGLEAMLDNMQDQLSDAGDDEENDNDEERDFAKKAVVEGGGGVLAAGDEGNQEGGADFFGAKAPARGISGLPMGQTPALSGASRGKIECDVDVDALAYWNDPQGDRDRSFRSPFADPPSQTLLDTKYVTFQPDSGGWNNIRMSMENIFIIAAALGRTIVLPSPMPLYLLKADTAEKHKGFADFYPLWTDEFQKRVPVISMEEFLKREGGSGGKAEIPQEMRVEIMRRGEHCNKMKKSE